MSKLTAMKKFIKTLLAISWRLAVIIAFITILGAGIMYLLQPTGVVTKDPYKGKNLELKPLPANYKIADVTWVDNEVGSTDCHSPIPDLPVNDCIYYTNIDFATDYQFAQTGGQAWGVDKKLFWRKRNADKWQEINLQVGGVNAKDFVIKNGNLYLVTTAKCQEQYCLFLTDPASGKSEKQFEAEYVEISPDKKKLAFMFTKVYSIGGLDSDHKIVVRDLESDTKTPITTIKESDPGSGISFGYKWSSDSKLLRITGRAYKIGDIDYIYDHAKKELYKNN